MPVSNWTSRVDRRVVVCPHGPQPLADEVARLCEQGYVKIEIHQERFTNRWHIESTKFIKVKED